MTIRAFAELKEASTHPVTGDPIKWIGGRFGGDDECYTCQAFFGFTLIPKHEIKLLILIQHEEEVSETDFPHVTFLNNINQADEE